MCAPQKPILTTPAPCPPNQKQIHQARPFQPAARFEPGPGTRAGGIDTHGRPTGPIKPLAPLKQHPTRAADDARTLHLHAQTTLPAHSDRSRARPLHAVRAHRGLNSYPKRVGGPDGFVEHVYRASSRQVLMVRVAVVEHGDACRVDVWHQLADETVAEGIQGLPQCLWVVRLKRLALPFERGASAGLKSDVVDEAAVEIERFFVVRWRLYRTPDN